MVNCRDAGGQGYAQFYKLTLWLDFIASRFLNSELNFNQALPPTVESRAEVKKLNGQLQGAYYDAEYGLQ